MKGGKNAPKGLLISPIENGTVIDHITAGEALNVLRIIGITGTTQESISVATNVESGKIGFKDIVKIKNRELRKEEVDKIALIAPRASININSDPYQDNGEIIPGARGLNVNIALGRPCCFSQQQTCIRCHHLLEHRFDDSFGGIERN